MKAVGYIRVSTERQEISPDAQRHMLEQWASSTRAELVAVHQDQVSGALERLDSVLTDGVVTTRVDLRKRPGLLAALHDIDALDACALVTVKRDRILRELEGMRVIQRLIAPARIIATTFSIDETTTLGRFAVGVVDLQAEAERGQIRERTIASLAQRRREGRRVGALRLGQAVDNKGYIIDAPDELASIALMLELRAKRGWGRRRIADELQRRYLAAGKKAFKPRGKRWQPGTVARVLARDRTRANKHEVPS